MAIVPLGWSKMKKGFQIFILYLGLILIGKGD
jgi:hypothetical protein